jgi:hypothetical protein
VAHPSVADTNGINRQEFRISDTPPLTPRRGGLLEGMPAWMPRGLRLLGSAFALAAVVLLFRAALAWPPVVRLRSSSPTRAAAAVWHGTRRGSGLLWRWLRTPAAVGVALCAFALAWRFLTFVGFSNDHYAHYALAQQMLFGDRPIRDFADPGWPLMYLLSLAAWLVAGDAMVVEWAINAAGFALGAAGTAATAHRLARSAGIAMLVTLIEIVSYPRTYSYPKVLLYAAAGWAIASLAAHASTRRLVGMGALVAVAFLFRHDHGLFIGIAAVVCVTLGSGGPALRIDLQVALRRATLLTATAAACLLPWILFVAFNGGLFSYFESALEYSRREADATRLSALPAFSLTRLFERGNAEAWLFWWYWSLPVVAAVIAFRRVRHRQERWPGEFAAMAALIVLAVCVNATFLRENLDARLADPIVPAALLGSWILGVCWAGKWQRRSLQAAAQVAAVVITVLSTVSIGVISDLRGQYDNTDIAHGLDAVRARARQVSHLLMLPHRQVEAPTSRYAVALMPFFTYLDRCTPQDDRLIVIGEFPEVPVLARRAFASDGVVFGAGYSTSVHQDRTVEHLRRRPALFALYMGDGDAFRTRFADVERYVSNEYTRFAEIPVDEGGTIRIVVLRSRAATGTDRETGWACFRE